MASPKFLNRKNTASQRSGPTTEAALSKMVKTLKNPACSSFGEISEYIALASEKTRPYDIPQIAIAIKTRNRFCGITAIKPKKKA